MSVKEDQKPKKSAMGARMVDKGLITEAQLAQALTYQKEHDLLLGEASPSGKLPVTFYRNEQLQEMPAFTDYSLQGRTYRYFEGEPLYPFGYGLTYGDVYVQAASVEKTADGVTVHATVKNDGAMDTEDVVQIYCQKKKKKNAPLHPRLVAFRRVSVSAGKTEHVSVSVKQTAFLVVNEAGDFVKEGNVKLYVGMGQPDARTQSLTGHASVTVDC